MKRKLVALFAVVAVFAWVPLSPLFNSTAHAESTAKTDVLKQTMELAKQGKAVNSGSFGLQSKKSSILKKWGKPEYQDQFTLNYDKHQVSFYLDNQGIVKSLETTDAKLVPVSHDQVAKTLGKPFESDAGAGQYYESYHAGKNDVTFHWTSMKKPNGELSLTSVKIEKAPKHKK
ncbi:protein of unknown function [Marininema mesophilum]|uniref:Beta-lactamase inhibitor (BLIP) n=1 Tax=Marininema mesophilum TaxID=1048340 RepID=A0A1H3CBG7_9BACL|nr:DUF4309 domain-containing protein [Marininema mesophilum]SDX51497.1 protein of unknown function [Marininema mesophilum]